MTKSSMSFATFSSASSSGGTPKAPTCEEDLWWKRGEEIGCGSYGSVHLARRKEDGQIFAVKIARIRGVEDKKYAEQFQRELEICRDLNHRNIVRCLGSDSIDRKLYIYMEYLPGGTLRRHIGEFGALEGNLLRKAARGALKGLHYLHTHNPPIVHRDLKGANVLLTLDFCVKLADFGCSKRGVDTLSFREVGSLHWMAPEIMQKAGHGRMADIWSFGCLLIEMATASDPWGRNAFGSILDAANIIGSSERTPPVPDSLPQASRDLISRCLIRAPEKRASTEELLEHEAVASSRTGSRAFRRGE